MWLCSTPSAAAAVPFSHSCLQAYWQHSSYASGRRPNGQPMYKLPDQSQLTCPPSPKPVLCCAKSSNPNFLAKIEVGASIILAACSTRATNFLHSLLHVWRTPQVLSITGNIAHRTVFSGNNFIHDVLRRKHTPSLPRHQSTS